jgi:Amt family ammonium transporter
VAERLRTISVVLLSALWTILVYAPLNCVLWYSLSHPNTIMLVDWSGAHAQLAIGSFAFALVVLTGNRHGYGRIPMAPYDMGRAIGGGMIFVFALWGFCEYGATAVQPGSSSGALNAAVAGFTGLLVWAFSEHLYRGVSSTLGMISGALCSTIAVSAFAGWSPTLGAIFVGGLGSVCGFFGAVVVRRWHAVDDTLDIFAIHAVPAFVGLCAAPIFVTHPGSHWATQILSAALVSVASFAVGAGSATGLKRLGVLRVTFDEEDAGLDVTSHGETVHPPQSTL